MQFFAEKSQNRTPREVPHQYLPLTRSFFPEKITLGYIYIAHGPISCRWRENV